MIDRYFQFFILSTVPADGPPNGQNPERWQKVQDPGIKGSFTGSYMQVLPDDRDSYNDIHGGNSFRMTGLEFRIRVYHPGLHTLFLRWTGGDTVGGGDSLYVVVYDRFDRVMKGVNTFKPAKVGIAEVRAQPP